MLKRTLLIVSASSILIFSNCASKKKAGEVTDSYKEEVAVEQPKISEPLPPELENKPSKFDNGGIQMNQNRSEIKEDDGEVITAPAKTRPPMTEKEKEIIKGKMRERMKEERKKGGR